MNGNTEPNYYLKPRFLFLVTIGAVFLVELLVMLLLRFLPDLAPAEEAFLDAILLSTFVGPFLYFFFLRPFHASIQKRRQTEIEHDKLKEIDKVKTGFMSIAAHELNTPLTTIMMCSEMLLMENQFGDDSRQEFASIINQKAETMERLIEDLLDLSRLELGQPLRIQKDEHDIVLTISSALNEYRRKYPQRHFVLHLPESPLFLYFDKVRIEQVLGNLLNNALKFSPPGSPVEVEGGKRNGEFLVRIKDRGIGLSPEQQARVFDRFYRADDSDTSAAGLGLGMTIAREIIVSHGGRISLESLPGKGTTVSFSLPDAR